MSFRLAGRRPAVVKTVAFLLALSSRAALPQNTEARVKPNASAPAASAATPAPAASAAAVPTNAPHEDNGIMAAKPGNAATGQAKAAACGACHGMDGNAPDAQYPNLAGQHEMYIAHQLHNFKSGERQNAIMLGMSTPLSAQDMRDIGAYFASKQSLPGVADQSLVEHGQKLYREGDFARGIPPCMACHGIDGRGNPGAMYPQLTSQHAQYVEAKLKDFHDGVVWGEAAHAKIMPIVAKSLDPKDIAALASYIEGLHVADPRADAKSP